jgi:hypothetical protein
MRASGALRSVPGRSGAVRAWARNAALALAAGLALATSAPAQVPRPALERGQGERCVEDTAYMRRSHMDVLMHHRDRTVREGVRTRQHSLAGCVECHAGAKTREVASQSHPGREGFCEGCHAYVGVQLDCFGCHATRPGSAVAAAKDRP